MKKIVENYLEFLASTAIAQDPRSFRIYGANPSIQKRRKKVRSYLKTINSRHRLDQNHY